MPFVMLLLSAIDNGTVCDRYRHSDFIFTGTAEDKWMDMLDTHQSPIHKRSEKSRRVRFLVREWYKGQRKDLMEIWITPANCPLKIEANQTYLVYALTNTQKKGRIESNGCLGTELVANATADLTYLQASLQGPGRATRISGTSGRENENVVAKSGHDTRYATANASGEFTFDGLPPGYWSLSAVGGHSQQVELKPDSCVSTVLPR